MTGIMPPVWPRLRGISGELADTVIVAPDRNQSGSSHSLTLDTPLRVGRTDAGVYFVNGTPTDCVHLAITGLLEDEPDMVVSGVNHGANLGDDVLYSGTVAAAIEGRFLGLPTIAVSLVSDAPDNLETAARAAATLVAAIAGRAARRRYDPQCQCAGPAVGTTRGVSGNASRFPPSLRGGCAAGGSEGPHGLLGRACRCRAGCGAGHRFSCHRARLRLSDASAGGSDAS